MVQEKKDSLDSKSKKKKRNYNYHSKTKAKMSARRSVKAKEKRIKQLQTKISNQKSSLKTQKKVLKKLDNKKTDNKVVLDSELDSLPPTVQAQIEKENVVFHPNEGPQTEFLAAPEKDVLYGGAAGGGKSYAMLVDPLRYAHKKAHRALILRRSMPELRELIDKSREIYPQA